MEEQKGLSVIIPVLNEAGNIPDLVARLSAVLDHIGPFELLFIDDHSTDGTVRVIEQYAKGHIPVFCYPKRGKRGKAQSILEGAQHVRYDVVAVIDGDLQYPPETIPEMLAAIDTGADIVVANRTQHNTGAVRRIVSWAFSFFFTRLLHGFSCDVQSGLKMFRKHILREVTIRPTPWTFDLEFLVQARHAGYRIETVNIAFAKRHAGSSKINLFANIVEIGWNALAVKARRLHPIEIAPVSDTGSMIGAGVAHRGQRFITHTSLSHRLSAFTTFARWQVLGITLAFAAAAYGLFVVPLNTMIVVVAILSGIYFVDMIFNLRLVLRSMRFPPEIRFTPEELTAVESKDLPIYTILCPLYREANVLPTFLAAMDRLDWPKHKLDIILLLEEDDEETISVALASDMPNYVRVAVVPHSMPKTKPKACNYGLGMARGEYLVVYDAEDIPDPNQLKKAYLGFARVPASVKCLQAKLNYHNPHDNMLTRLFTAEYSLWFNVVLTGLQSVESYIPLGGTSNHFRVKDIRSLQGWDPFNVTEDCDLGARILKRGFRTAIIESTTLEEANSSVRNWIRQRSRWIKGYTQTYLIHMRSPFRFFRQRGWDALLFQLVVGGKIAFLLINPILWLATASYFLLYAYVGEAIEAVYPTAVFYIAGTSLVFGNFLYIFYYMIGLAKRRHWSLVKYIYLVPVYWFLASVAATVAIYQLIFKPHYWEKTKHGLHLARRKTADITVRPAASAGQHAPSPVLPGPPAPTLGDMPAAEMFAATARLVLSHARALRKWFGRITQLGSSVASQVGILSGVIMISNFLNFIFNAFLGRVLTFEDLGLVTLINTFWYIMFVFISGIGATVNYRTAYLSFSREGDTSTFFLRETVRRALLISGGLALIWVAGAPFLARFFQLPSLLPIFLFTPVFAWGVVGASYRGYLQGRLFFGAVAVAHITESFGKLVIAGLLVWFGLGALTYIAIPAVVGIGALVSWFLVRRRTPEAALIGKQFNFPTQFYGASLMAGIASVIFLSLDIVLVKHFLDPTAAGQYALLSLVGKMIFFFGSLPTLFMLTFVGRDIGLGQDTVKTLRRIFLATLALVVPGAIALGPLGPILVPILLGAKTLAILPYLNIYVFGIALFTLGNVIISYHLAKQHYVFPIVSLFFSVLMAAGIIAYHGSIDQIVAVISMTGAASLTLLVLMHRFERDVVFAGRVVRDLVSAFIRDPKPIIVEPGRKRILVFNWRDVRHAYAGGAELYIHEMAKQLIAHSHHVTLFCGNDGKSSREEVLDGVHIIRRGGFYLVYAWAILYYLFQFRRRYDVVIDCHNGIPFFTPLYAAEPVYCVMHHVHQEVFRHSLAKPLAWFAGFLEGTFMPFVYRKTPFITVSESSKHDIESLGLAPAGVTVVSPGVDLNIFRSGTKSSHPLVLYLGRLKAYKSIDTLITAFRSVLERYPDAELVVAGSGEEARHLKRLAAQLGIENRVRFPGKVSDAEKLALLQESWVMVNPSLMEGWGITTIEANACGTPVVAADVPGLRDSVNDFETGFLVPHGDTMQFAERINRIVEHEKLRTHMGERAVEWASRFDWERLSNTFLVYVSNYRDKK